MTTKEAAIHAYLSGVDYAQSHAPYFRESPLSGEYAGESMPEIAHRYDLPADEADWADDFEDGYHAHASSVRNDDEFGPGNW